MISFLKRQWFVCSIAVIVACSYFLPALPKGTWQGHVKFGLVAAIFLCSGLGIRTRELGDGLRNWRLHLFVQGLSLVVTVLVCWALDSLWASLGLSTDLRLGLLVLGALPTTVTSCVALTAAAGGNQSGALVNACIGNLLGVVVTPLWLMLVASTTGAQLELLPVLKKLGTFIGIPVLVGQVIQFAVGERMPPALRKRLGKIGQALLLGIMYISFQKAFHNGSSVPASLVGITLAICLGLHLSWLTMAWYGSLLPPFALSPKDRRCAVICGSQKTLAMGLPLIAVCFADHPGLPLIALPILIYHPMQMLIAGVLVPRLANSLPSGGESAS